MEKFIKILNIIMVNYIFIAVIFLSFNPNRIPYAHLLDNFDVSAYFSPNPIVAIATTFCMIGLILFNFFIFKLSKK